MFALQSIMGSFELMQIAVNILSAFIGIGLQSIILAIYQERIGPALAAKNDKGSFVNKISTFGIFSALPVCIFSPMLLIVGPIVGFILSQSLWHSHKKSIAKSPCIKVTI